MHSTRTMFLLGVLMVTPALAEPTDSGRAALVQDDNDGVEALYRAATDALQHGDVKAFADLHDFPATLITNSADGNLRETQASREEFIKRMTPMISGHKRQNETEKHTVYFLAANLASVEQEHTVDSGGTKSSFHSTALLVRKEGTWKFKVGVWALPPEMTGKQPMAFNPAATPPSPGK